MEKMEIGDLFRSASLLCLGAELDNVRCEKKEVLFTLKGSGLRRQDQDYKLGKARVNPQQLENTLNYLRDIIFENRRKGEVEWGSFQNHR